MQILSKTHHTAVAVLPPADLWEPIQAIRRRYDRHMYRWMPHINLLYPFFPGVYFSEVLPLLGTACAQVCAFEVTLTSFRFFTHASGTATLWLQPEPREALDHLQATLRTIFPICDDLSRFANGFTPHLSVGQFRSRHTLQPVLDSLQASWQPLRFSLTAIALLWRQAAEPFQVAHWVPLAPPAAPASPSMRGGVV
jgi:RNA 2',3'-cyclic 3'-phosphodiesterase